MTAAAAACNKQPTFERRERALSDPPPELRASLTSFDVMGACCSKGSAPTDEDKSPYAPAAKPKAAGGGQTRGAGGTQVSRRQVVVAAVTVDGVTGQH